MVAALNKFAAENGLFKKGDKILIAVSGGRDSIVLCELFHQSKHNFGIAHCNYQLRGKESMEDESFVKGIASKYKVEFFSKRFETKKTAKEKGSSIQETARVLRYNWFEQIRKQNGYDYIATAHHKDDSIETFFINLIRGTGIAGLHGILPKRGNIIRPLLFAGRNEINEFIKSNKLKFREDSSNASNKYLRNKIRNNILPLFDQINPSFRDTLLEDILRLNETEKVFNYYIETCKEKVLKRDTISISGLKEFPFPSVLLYEILKKYHFNSDVSQEVFSSLDAKPGKIFYSPTHRLVKDRELLIITEKKANDSNDTFFISKDIKRISVPVKLELSQQKISDKYNIPKNNNIACLDFEKLHFPLEIRRWKKGDYFYPLGMKEKKKLSDFFSDNKFSIPEKEETWLLCSGGNIVWIINHRIDDRYKVGKNTKMIYFVRYNVQNKN